MEQETRNNNILSTLANLFDSQAHGIQSNQSNGNTGSSNLPDRIRVESTTSQTMNAHLLNVNGQLSSTVSGSSGTTSDADISDLDGLSALMNPNYTNSSGGTTNHLSQDALYEATSHIGMAADVSGVMETRMPQYSSSMMDFSSAQNQQILDPFSTIDTSTAAGAQSYVSLLQQQPAELWSNGQVVGATGGSYGNGNKQQLGNNRPQSNQALQSGALDKSLMHQQTALPKTNTQIQHSQLSSANRGNRLPQQYAQNGMLSYSSDARQASKNLSEIAVSINNSDGMQFPNEIGNNRGREKKLTTTPIPSDADKSSCSSASSDGISGPEHSPDHITDHPPSSMGSLEQCALDNNALMGDSMSGQHSKQKRDNRSMRNMDTSKNYPCYGNMNLGNFRTINFAPVMDTTHSTLNSVDIARNPQQQDGGMPLPTSDSIIEIDATVTSPLENIPMSPTTPTGADGGGNVAKNFVDIQSMHGGSQSSYAQMQTVSAMHNMVNMDMIPNPDGRKSSKSRPRSESRRMTNYAGRSVDSNNNNVRKLPPASYSKNFANLSTVTSDKLQEKQKKTRSSKHKHQNPLRPGDLVNVGDVVHYGYPDNSEGDSHQNHLKPKMNADPMASLRQNYNATGRNRQTTNADNLYGSGSSAKPVRSVHGMNPATFSSQPTQITHCTTSDVPASGAQNSGQTRVWQTVTAVQGPKLPPVLSEQDRIPKRGRPSKKMMQQNLKIKGAQNSSNVSSKPSTVSNPVASKKPSHQEIVPPTSQSSNLVAMYTINDKGIIEEIAPKPKESRRSKERTQAFLKYLDEIKMSSKSHPDCSKNSGDKDGEKQKKKSSRPRSKVFGRQNNQPLTESGITETMCTFSALAHQFKISNSIVERATENLLKSAAIKRNKEQNVNLALGQQQKRRLPEKSISVQKLPSRPGKEAVFNNNKGVPSTTNHCEMNFSGSVVPSAPSAAIKPPATKNSMANSNKLSAKDLNSSQTVAADLPKSGQLQPRVAPITHDKPVAAAASSAPVVVTSLPVAQKSAEISPEQLAVPLSPDVEIPSDAGTDIDGVGVKSKHKKKKQKKHKKHKYSELSTGKKKKKDKEKKKKTKRKLKAKLTPSKIPSATVSLLKSSAEQSVSKEGDVESPPSTQIQTTASSSFKNGSLVPTTTESTSITENATPWPIEDNICEVDDSSSDETVTSPKSCHDMNAGPFSSSTPSSIAKTQPSFAQYSQSRIGFGTFSMEKSPPRLPEPEKDTSSNADAAVAVIGDLSNNDSAFGSQTLLRPNKKTTKHKKKKLFKKSKTCDPAFVATLDKLLMSLENMRLDPTKDKATYLSSMSKNNIFLNTSIGDTQSSLSLWRSPSQKSAKKVPTTSNVVRKSSSLFPKDGSIPGFGSTKPTKKSEFRLQKSKSSSSIPEGGQTNSVSVFCRSPFFHKHGYVNMLNTEVEKGSLDFQKVDKSDTPKLVSKSAATSKKAPVPRQPSKKDSPDKSDVTPSGSISSKSSNEIVTANEVSVERTTEKPEVPRKRGWPRGKPRGKGPRNKRQRLSQSDQQKLSSTATLDKSTSSEKNSEVATATKKVESSKEKETESLQAQPEAQDQQTSSSSSLANNGTPTNSLNDVINDSLLQQIKQAIEANLPRHPSVNKEVITKSVDAAVQSYLQNLKKGQSTPDQTENTETEGHKKKSVRRKSRAEPVAEKSDRATESSPKVNSDIHPKKIWACKHQDTETSSSKPAGSSEASVGGPVKRGRGRPRKYPVPNGLSVRPTTSSKLPPLKKQGKVPTASATVVPTKRKVLTVRLPGKCVKPTVRKLLARAKTDVARHNVPSLPHRVNAVVTKEAAISCLSALCSIKAAKVLAKSGDRDDDSKTGFYAGLDIDEHLNETIDYTVKMYSCDNYRKFEEECMKVAKEMGFVDESDIGIGDSRPKAQGFKKSIESVVAKLKNKQVLNMQNVAANALLELHHTYLDDKSNVIIAHSKNVDSDENYRKAGRQQDIYEEVSSYQGDSNHTSTKPHKVKHAGRTQSGGKSVGGVVPVKRPRGRPKLNRTRNDAPAKKRRLSSAEGLSQAIDSRDMMQQSGSIKERVKSHHGNLPRVKKITAEIDPFSSSCKKYLNAGLYSSTFKRDNPKTSNTDGDIERLLSTTQPKLPPPVDAGLYLRTSRKDFQLPYKIWWMYKHGKISASQDPSNNYIKITENVYTAQKPSVNMSDHICNCNPDKEVCGRQCLNRLMYMECHQNTCPCRSRCTNQAIQEGGWCKSLERFKTRNCGWGIRTTKSISEGSFILEYVGEVVSEVEFRKRTVELYHAYNNHYCVQLDSSNVIDGYRMANEGRFINHSCEPNCEMQKWSVNGEHRIALFALRNILPDEELTYDYNFHAYNMDTQQACRCGSQKCRGIIGGRSQRSFSSDSDSSASSYCPITIQHTKLGKQSQLKAFKSKDEVTTVKDFSTLQMKPIPKRERDVIRSQQLFLLRNLSQVRRKEEEEQRRKPEKKSVLGDSSNRSKSGQKQKSKKSTQSREDKERVEAALTEMYTAIATCKDQNGVSVAIPFMNLPSKKKNPEYYERISDPIDLSIIERNIVSNHYKDIETFNNDVQRVFKNAEKYHGKKSTLGKDVSRLRKAYANARGAAMLLINGQKKPANSSEVSDDDLDEADENIHRKNEDHIRCICCIYRDEGVMVQCEKCYVWQHCDCMGVEPDKTDHYLCEECDPRPCPKEVKVTPPPPSTPPGHTYYLNLLKDDLLVKQGDCAYLMRDHRLRHTSNSPSVRASHRNFGNISHEKLDIYRIEQLWTDESGDKYAYGYHFLRPHETTHAPSRTFYHNELFASPFYEIIPLEAVVGLCCVMDLYTYCKGKPKDFKMSDLYICDYRVDKAASSFNRIAKKKYPICTKPHVFDTYKHKLCPRKDFQPHKVPEQYRRSAGRPSSSSEPCYQDGEELLESAGFKRKRSEDNDNGRVRQKSICQDKSKIDSTTWKKRERLDGIANKLLSKLPDQAGVDVSYLLEPGTNKRHRKKASTGKQ